VFVSSPTDEPLPPHPLSASRKRRPAARRRLSREAILTAALEVLDAEGLDAVSMRRVAEALDTGPASLYAYVANKDELLELLVDRVMADLVVPPPDPERWQEQLKDLLRAGRDALAAHRDIARANLGIVPIGPNATRIAEGMLAILVAGGVPTHIAALAGDTLTLYIVAHAYEATIWQKRFDEEGFAYTDRLREYFASLPADRFPHISSMAAELTGSNEDDARFEFGLDILVSGVDAAAKRAR
jgi:AcrR family transcriptional regulator